MNLGFPGFQREGSSLLEKITSVLVTSPVSEISINRRYDNYESIILRILGRSTTAGTTSTFVRLQFNGDTGNNYAFSRLNRFGSSNTAALSSLEIGDAPFAGNPAGRFHWLNLEILFPGDTLRRKNVLGTLQNMSDLTIQVICGEWASLQPITSMKLFLASGNFDTNSQVDIFGIRK